MSRPPVVTGWRGASFGGVDFARNVVRWEDTRDRRGKTHEYIKRDGGEGEDTGRAPHVSVIHLAYIGPTWMADYKRLQAAIDDNPIQTLVHPIHGSMTARSVSVVGHMDIEGSPNLYEVVARFEESQVDTNVTADGNVTTQGPTAKQQAVTGAATGLQTSAAPFPSALIAVNNVIAAASLYASSAVASVQAQAADPTLAQQLANVQTLTNTAITVILADSHAAPGVSDPAVMAAELLYDTCTQMDDSVRALRPRLALFVVPIDMHITALAQFLYGPVKGPTREAEILVNNANIITDPAYILAGTQLQVAPATVTR